AVATAEVPEDVVRLELGEVQQCPDRYLRCRLIQDVGDTLAGAPRPEIDRLEVTWADVNATGDRLRTLGAGNDRLDGVDVVPRWQRRRLEGAHRAGRFGLLALNEQPGRVRQQDFQDDRLARRLARR